MMIKDLQALGMGEKEAKIYAAALELGTTSTAELASKSGLKRPTVYLYLSQMVQEGYMETVISGKKSLYKPADPSMLEKKIVQSQQSIEVIKKAFLAGQMHSGKPHVQVYEGLENVRRIYDEMGNENLMRFWSNVEGVQPLFFNEWTRLSERYNTTGATIREIIADKKSSRRFSKYLRGIIGPTYAPRVATAEGLFNDGAVSSKALYIFRLHEFNFHVVKIEDTTIASTYGALFDMAWKNAKPL